ncbi:MAG: FIST signal transduction protein [Mucilaginibacter sp.]
MKVNQKQYKDGGFTIGFGDNIANTDAQLVLGFGNKGLLAEDNIYTKLKTSYPLAEIVLCSTSGEIYNDSVYDNTVSVVVVEFEKTMVKSYSININEVADSFAAGKLLFSSLNAEDLTYVMIISDGSLVNGSELVRGIDQINVNKIPVTGGLAGDGDQFNYTAVGCNTEPKPGNIVAVGFYGNSLKIGHASLGGWELFGPEKKVTRSISNRLFEIDNKSALELYKQYLGKYAEELPGSALLFPLHVRADENSNGVVRTILSIDLAEQAMVFAGDIPEGAYVRFMKANFDKVIDAATQTACNTLTQFSHNQHSKPKLAILISCVGRKLVLSKRIEEEIEAVKDIFGNETIISGFYSYGEISPLAPATKCELHNQTMTITTFSEDITP